MATDCRWRKKMGLVCLEQQAGAWQWFWKGMGRPIYLQISSWDLQRFILFVHASMFYRENHHSFTIGSKVWFFLYFSFTIKEYDKGNTCYCFFPLLNVRMYFIVTKVLHILFAFNVIISWNVHFVNNSVAFFCLSQKGLTTFTYF